MSMSSITARIIIFAEDKKMQKAKRKKKIECNSLGLANSFDTVFGEKKRGGKGGRFKWSINNHIKKRKKEKIKMDPKLVQKKRMINGSTKKKE